MKKHFLILFSAAVFTVLFYNQSVGLNLSIFGLFLLLSTWLQFPDVRKNSNFIIANICAILILVSNAWLFGPETFIMSFLSLALVRVYAQYPDFKLFLTPVIICAQGLATLVRVFYPKYWLQVKPTSKTEFFKKLLAYVVIPLFFIILFVTIYALNSNVLSNLFSNFSFNVVVILIFLLGFYLSFSFWDGWIYSGLQNLSESCSDDLIRKENENQLLSEKMEIKSGIITFSFLNVLLLIFIGIYTYEQFFQSINQTQLSAQTHQRVNLLIVSIVLAVAVILYFFKNRVNFSNQNAAIKKLAYGWMFLNTVLIVITALKTIDYILHLGLTYQRLGVLCFLGVCLFGLGFTYIKVAKAKSTFYLLNKSSWLVYIALVVVAVPNWSSVITSYNLSQSKTDVDYLIHHVRYNEKQLLEFFSQQPEANQYHQLYNYVKRKQSHKFLSQELYYESIKLDEFPQPKQ